MKPLGLFALTRKTPLQETLPGLSPDKIHIYPYNSPTKYNGSATFLPNLSAFGVWESFRAVSKARSNFEYLKKYVFQKFLRVPFGQTFDTTLPLSLFFSAERYGRHKIVRVPFRLGFLCSSVYPYIHRKHCRSCALFPLPLWCIL